MPIENFQIKFMKSQAVNDAPNNGGRMSDVEAANSVKNNVWPDVPASERTAGSTKYRKLFIKIANPDNLQMYDAHVFVQKPTPAGDRVVFFAGTQRDTQSDVSGATNILYGSGHLNSDVLMNATVLSVNVEEPDDVIFRPGQTIRIFNKVSVDDNSGTEEFLTLGSDPSAVSWNGSLATLTLAAGESVLNNYSASNTMVASVLKAGNVVGSTDAWALGTTAGTLGGWDGSGIVPATLADLRMVDHIAGIEQTWTLTFSSATAFSCVGDTVGAVSGGSTLANFAPNNPAYSRPYFTLPASLWAGVWASTNSVSFMTHPAAIPIWEKRIIPVGTSSLAGNKVVIGVSGESE
ncbi:MAG: hypothetical protein H7839_00910 [Magnetococcus sp. YQC-5]